MKRYASHYLFFPGYGYLKQYVVEIEGGCVVRIFPLIDEVENAEWLPGVIVLLHPENSCIEETAIESVLQFDITSRLSSVPLAFEEQFPFFVPYLLYPFDFVKMQPVSETRSRRLL